MCSSWFLVKIGCSRDLAWIESWDFCIADAAWSPWFVLSGVELPQPQKSNFCSTQSIVWLYLTFGSSKSRIFCFFFIIELTKQERRLELIFRKANHQKINVRTIYGSDTMLILGEIFLILNQKSYMVHKGKKTTTLSYFTAIQSTKNPTQFREIKAGNSKCLQLRNIADFVIQLADLFNSSKAFYNSRNSVFCTKTKENY